ncbi:RHS repeat-associated core domain protein [Neisseria mucosa ATCC 25996]|uniref:RHS repeat-associated core domain protein n=1 Tax=Neisseria mucosa (strain ATCC 25996 / DSM 4631 / NCTC 10774 / M26) TaxID=546266 RepID=D2ZY43_NEIM2|nr:RHS repeat-associated core domain protein [Neisseria mucosa ATCC 25996]
MGEGWGEGKTTAPISDDPKTQGRLKSPANPNLTGGNRLKEYNGIEYTYDALGNLIYRQLPNGENQYYQYDLENQLVRAEIKKPAGNTEIWTYAYDPFGRRLSKERQDKLAWTSTDPKRTHFVWDGTRLLQEYTYKGSYTYIYTDQDSYEPLAQVFRNNQDEAQYLAYFHTDQIGIPREMTDIHGNLLWYGEYTAWGRLKKDERVYKNAHQPFRLQNQYYDEETGLHYNLMRYYEPEAGRFVNQDPIGLWGGENLYSFAPNAQEWIDPLGLAAEGTLGTYGKLKGGGNQAHEFIRNKMLELMGETSAGKRLSENPSIAASHERHQGRDNSNSIHKNEKRLAQKHLGLKSKNQFETSVCKRSGVKQGRIMPSKRQMDVWQGAIRMAGYGPSRARKLRKQAQRYLRSLGY